MAEESLRITITADNKQALAGLQQTVKSLDQVDKAAGSTSGKVVSMGKDFTGLSRVIQDLPYGFNAIANNLTNILPAAGMVGLAVSGAVAAFQIFSMGIDNFMARFWGFRKSVTDAKKENDDFVSILAKEKTQLDLLFTTANNANAPLGARLKAVKDLRNEYGNYLQDFSDEEILAGEASEAYKKLTEAILMSARARAASNMLTELQGQLLQEEQGAIDDLTQSQEKTAQAAAWRGQAQAAQTSGLGFAKDELQVTKLQNAASKELLDNLTKRGAKIAEIKKQMDFLNKTIQQNQVEPFTNTGGGGGNSADSIKEVNRALEEQIGIHLRLRDARIKAQGQGALGTIMPERDKAKDLTNLKLTTDGNAALNQVLLRQSELQDQRNQNLAIANGLTDMAMNSISGLVNAMANGQNIGQALGDMFKRLAVDIALAAAKAMIFQAILGAINPASAFGKSGFFQGFKKILGFSEGGTVSGPKSGYPVMLHGTEHIVRPDQMRSIIASAAQMGGGNSRVIVEGRISGQDIWLSQQRTNTFRALTT